MTLLRNKIVILLHGGCYLLLLVCTFWLLAPSVEAASCTTITDKQVCLVRIKRSAKNYWEYRVIFSFDGKKQRERIYNCRDFYYLQSDKLKTYYLETDPLAKYACRLYQN